MQLGENSIGWPLEEIEAWEASLPRRTYGADLGKVSIPDRWAR